MYESAKNHSIATFVALVAMSIASSNVFAGGLLDIEFEDADFSDPPSLIIDNPFWPLRPDEVPRTFTYIGETDDECVIDQISVSDNFYGATYILTGAEPYTDIEVVQVVDTEWVFEDLPDGVECNLDLLPNDDAIKELTLDWYLEDNQNNIWYVGEYSQSFEDDCAEIEFDPTGETVPFECKEGSWEAGKNGAPEGEEAVIGQAGIVVPGDEPIAGEPLTPGTYFMQEVAYEAEDMAKILKLNASVEDAYPGVDYENCRKVKEWTALEPGASVEHKWYCHLPGTSGPGLVLIEGVGGGQTEVEELIDITPAL